MQQRKEKLPQKPANKNAVQQQKEKPPQKPSNEKQSLKRKSPASSTDTVSSTDTTVTKPPCDYPHNNLTSFRQETNSAFCKDGFYLDEMGCQDCNGKFHYKNNGNIDGQLWVKPSLKTPVFVCIGNTEDCECQFAYCSNCCAKNLMK
jgi:hypothetical protein